MNYLSLTLILQKQFNLALNLIINDTFSLETKKKQLEKAITSCLQYLKEKKYIKVEPKKICKHTYKIITD